MKSFYKLTLLLSILSLLALPLAACASKPASTSGEEMEGTVAVSGAWALYPMMTRWAEEFQKLHPKVQFDVSAGGAGKGMADALAGAVDIGMVSRDITPEEEGKGAFWVAVTKDAVFPTINAQNPALQDLLKKGVTRQQFIDLYINGTIKTWGELAGRPEITDEIHLYTRSDAAGAPETWAKYLGMKQEDLLGVAVFGDPGVMDAVVKDPLGIGFNNLGYAYDLKSGKPVEGAAVLPIDYNENGQADPDEVLETMSEAIEMVATNKYPSPPARALNLVTNGKPTNPIVMAFIQWILTDGQQFVGEAGYVKLPQEQLDAGMLKLK
jgi:phosphate transport system substrate-binding protein